MPRCLNHDKVPCRYLNLFRKQFGMATRLLGCMVSGRLTGVVGASIFIVLVTAFSVEAIDARLLAYVGVIVFRAGLHAR